MERKRYTWKTADIIQETPDAITVIFNTQDQPFEYFAGQFVNVSLIINGETVSRSYSLSSSPSIDKFPSITVKRVRNGLMSEYILSNLSKIKEWTIEGPHGLFYISEDHLLADHAVFIAAGSGISPIYSMISHLLQHSTCHITLIYSTKQLRETIFFQHLSKLEAHFSNRFTIHYVLTGTSDLQYTPVRKFIYYGRLSLLQLKKLLKPTTSPGKLSHYFICGPEGFIEKTEEALNTLNVMKEFIHKEYFVAPKKSIINLPTQKFDVLLHFKEQTNLLEVPPGQTILAAALEDKIPIPYSCKSGTCGVCTAKLTKGSVHMQNNFALSEILLQQHFILLCQSHPIDDAVTIEMD